MSTTRMAAVVLVATLVAPAACTDEPSPRTPSPQHVRVESTATTPPPSTADPAAVGANELGVVPVLMYHRIVPAPASVYDRTPAAFRAELVRLARENYVPVTAASYAGGDIDIPAGTHPVVLTFDDGDRSQFSLDAAGRPAAGTAVSIMQEVAEEFPGFRPVATFFVNAEPFGAGDGLEWLAAHGMEIGNHTATHLNLGQSTPDQARQDILAQDQAIRRAVPGFSPATLAFPFGAVPDDPGLALHGAVGPAEYRYKGAFLVGANPAPSPYAADFDPAGIPRIRSQDATGPDAEHCSTVWLDKLAAAPSQRYTSDGDPDRISFPATSQQQPAARFGDRVRTY
ncbi:polysaccharide deacetylase family protein [Actinophytocola glycyrrhizae]|uniref:Polysaccharide deacetylase family protein n=1 Tax=Actinophytocola glycyrrhizae TaxID=2044873 RepID=A0ABV9SB82_9PSEU